MKVRKTTNRGTSTTDANVGEQNWAGDSFRKFQQHKFEKIGKNVTMHLGRGIKTTRSDNLPAPKPRLSTKGMTRVTNRGTGRRESVNTGN